MGPWRKIWNNKLLLAGVMVFILGMGYLYKEAIEDGSINGEVMKYEEKIQEIDNGLEMEKEVISNWKEYRNLHSGINCSFLFCINFLEKEVEEKGFSFERSRALHETYSEQE